MAESIVRELTIAIERLNKSGDNLSISDCPRFKNSLLLDSESSIKIFWVEMTTLLKTQLRHDQKREKKKNVLRELKREDHLQFYFWYVNDGIAH